MSGGAEPALPSRAALAPGSLSAAPVCAVHAPAASEHRGDVEGGAGEKELVTKLDVSPDVS